MAEQKKGAELREQLRALGVSVVEGRSRGSVFPAVGSDDVEGDGADGVAVVELDQPVIGEGG